LKYQASSAAEWDRLGDDVARFDQFKESHVFPEAVLDSLGGRALKNARSARQLRPSEIRRLQEQLRSLFLALRPTHPETVTEWTYPALPARITRVHVGTSADTSSIYEVYGAPWPDRFWLAVLWLLKAHGPRFRRCMAPKGTDRCGRLFLQAKREPHCSRQCSQRARARTWYVEHAEDVRKRRRDAYASEVRAKHPGAKLKIASGSIRRRATDSSAKG
jgi:hypothetical protein